jgi:ketosteroid isomerase-like protein
MSTTVTTDVRSDIRRADDAFEKHFSDANAAGIAELYTSTGMLLPPGSDPMQGKEAIRDFWQGAMNMGIKEAKLDIMEVELQGDSIIEVGRYQLKGAGDEVMDWGKYLVVWKQEGGEWKLHHDIWNTSRTA